MDDAISATILAFVVVIFVGVTVAYFQYREEPQNKKTKVHEDSELQLTGSVNRDERGLYVHLSWKRPDRPNWRQHCQLYRTPSFLAGVAQGTISWMNIYEYEFKDYDVTPGSYYEYTVIEPDWNTTSGPTMKPKGPKSNVLRIAVNR